MTWIFYLQAIEVWPEYIPFDLLLFRWSCRPADPPTPIIYKWLYPSFILIPSYSLSYIYIYTTTTLYELSVVSTQTESEYSYIYLFITLLIYLITDLLTYLVLVCGQYSCFYADWELTYLFTIICKSAAVKRRTRIKTDQGIRLSLCMSPQNLTPPSVKMVIPTISFCYALRVSLTSIRL